MDFLFKISSESSTFLYTVQVLIIKDNSICRTAFTVITTLGATSAAWASYFARQKHNQKLYSLSYFFIL